MSYRVMLCRLVLHRIVSCRFLSRLVCRLVCRLVSLLVSRLSSRVRVAPRLFSSVSSRASFCVYKMWGKLNGTRMTYRQCHNLSVC